MNFKMKDGDLVLDEDNHLVRANKIESISQKAEYSIKTNLQEDYIDPHLGIKYISPNNTGEIGRSLVEVEVEQQILETLKLIPGVQNVELLGITIDSSRNYNPKYNLILEDDTRIEGR